MSKVKILDVEIDNIGLEDALSRICELAGSGKPELVLTLNVDHVVKLQKDPEFRKIYKEASLVLADGMPILWAARFLKTSLAEKVSGSDLFPRLCGLAAEKGYKVFFLGGRPGVAAKASEVLRAKYPAIQIAGVYSPAPGFETEEPENRKIVGMIRDAAPDILFVGLGTPKQEKWIHRHINEHRVPVSIGIGASFDFVSGVKRRAPGWMQGAGLEWLWRLMMEPGRLWKRYLIDDMRFFWLVFREKNSSSSR